MSFSASAVFITPDLTITGVVNFDSDLLNGSLPAQGNATQTATIKSILGGTLSTSTVNNVTVAGNNHPR
jgi:hypothetical protein